MDNNLEEDFLRDFFTCLNDYKSIIISSHSGPDADSAFSAITLKNIIKEFDPDIKVFPVLDFDTMTEDCKTIIIKYGLNFYTPDDDELEKPDAVILVDTQMNERANIPMICPRVKVDEKLSYCLDTKYMDIICIDHHKNIKEKINKTFKYKLDYSDSKSLSTAAIIMNLFKDTAFIKDRISEDEGYCTLGHQAIKVDSGMFSTLVKSEKDISALSKFPIDKVNWGLIEAINTPVITEDQGKIQSVLSVKDNYLSIEPISYCHVKHPFEMAGDLGKAADRMRGLSWTNEIIIVSGIHSRGENQQDTLDISIRSLEYDDRLPEIAELFGGSGRITAAGAQMPLGFFKHVSLNEKFADIFKYEIVNRLKGSGFYKKEDDKPVPRHYDDYFSIDGIINYTKDKKYSELYRQIIGKIDHAIVRQNKKTLVLGINIYENPENSLDLGEKNIPSIIRATEILTESWGKGDAEEVERNIVYALINQGVRPYVLSVHCIKNPIDETSRTKNENIINGLFGSQGNDIKSYETNIENLDLQITIVKTPILELLYDYSKELLTTAIDYEINKRMDKEFGKKD